VCPRRSTVAVTQNFDLVLTDRDHAFQKRRTEPERHEELAAVSARPYRQLAMSFDHLADALSDVWLRYVHVDRPHLARLHADAVIRLLPPSTQFLSR